MTNRSGLGARRAADHAARLRASRAALALASAARALAMALALAFATTARAQVVPPSEQLPSPGPCDPREPVCGFALPDSVTVPPGIGGIPVWNVRGCYRLVKGAPLSDRFALERRDGTQWRALPFRLRLQAPDAAGEAFGANDRADVLWLAPDEGFVPGATYRFTRKQSGDAAMATLDVFVAHEGPGADTRGARLVTGDPVTGPLTPDEAPYGGWPRTDVVRRNVSLVLPESWKPFAGALAYATSVDGVPWRATFTPCHRANAPGVASLGEGREVIYAWCAPPSPTRRIETAPEGEGPRAPARVLQPGAHEVAMYAWIPGTTIGVRARAVVTLPCRW